MKDEVNGKLKEKEQRIDAKDDDTDESGYKAEDEIEGEGENQRKLGRALRLLVEKSDRGNSATGKGFRDVLLAVHKILSLSSSVPSSLSSTEPKPKFGSGSESRSSPVPGLMSVADTGSASDHRLSNGSISCQEIEQYLRELEGINSVSAWFRVFGVDRLSLTLYALTATPRPIPPNP